MLENMVDALCSHVSDESPKLRSLCLEGLVQIPKRFMDKYIDQVLGVIVALLEDSDDSVQLTAVKCLQKVLDVSPEDVVAPILISLSLRLWNLQVHVTIPRLVLHLNDDDLNVPQMISILLVKLSLSLSLSLLFSEMSRHCHGRQCNSN